MSIGACADAGGRAALARIEPDVDLVVVEIGTGGEGCNHSRDVMGPRVMQVCPFLQPRIVLLEAVAAHLVVQVEGEVGIQIE